ncbi:glycoside hydrolase family 73 protein [Parvimonas sp. C2]|uniref:glycoside hydrolase family 73 protein n=1 Tax=Parvimonas sp. C2 TaxID=3110692 RepID=UPI002B458DFA|nr:glucosaminidase domain-containing protein [Parvimonas sp. C2]MEB3072617.1 glucosaminidase domain-containing protein [Parvimonas sp. C2]
MKIKKKVLVFSLLLSSVLVSKDTFVREKIVEAAEYRHKIFYGDDGKPANWWYDDGKDWYFFQNGKKHNGYGKDASGKKFFDNGKYANWWNDDGKEWYFFQKGEKHSGYGEDASGKKFFDNGKYASWWHDDGKDWYFFQNGKKYNGYGKDNSGKRFFYNGKYANGWCEDDEDWFFFQNGYKHSGYGIDANGTKYFYNGKYAGGWYDDGKDWYFFKDGSKHHGYGTDGNGKKYFYNGKYTDGWYDDGEDWYFFKNGEKFTGRAKDESGYRDFVNGKYRRKSFNNAFIDKIYPGVLKAVKGKGLFPSVAVAQACLETGFGKDSLSPPPIYNLFGIKAPKGTPPSRYHEIRTAEYKNGVKYYITARFMKFTGYDEAFEYYAKLFTKNKWLRNYYSGVLSARTPEEAARALTGTYATDPNYGKKLLNIIDKYGLRELDK